jgi:triacylglycerol esterase/lipase EstA (alpha/beta hydrolase family)
MQRKKVKYWLKVFPMVILFAISGCGGGGSGDNSGGSTTSDTVPPVITVLGDNPASVVESTDYVDAGATATDNIDGTVAVTTSGEVNTSIVGSYTISYTATDSAGNSGSASREVIVVAAPIVDTVAPVITILGDNPVNVVQGTTYTDPGATATDDIDGDVEVVSSGAVDTGIVGNYVINYTAQDASGNVANAHRNVNVTPVQTTISGIVVDESNAGVSVTVSSINGEQLAISTTNAAGRFTIAVNEADIQQGYLLTATGWQIFGQTLQDGLSASYTAAEDIGNANITIITTLIDALAASQSGSTYIQKRDNAIAEAVALGLVKTGDFGKLDGEYTEENVIEQMVVNSGLNSWLNELVTDVSDREVNESYMAAFPKANGGIRNISVLPGDNVSLFAGNSLQIAIETEVEGEVVYSSENMPSWVSISDSTINVEPSTGVAQATYQFNVIAKANGIAVGKKRELTVSVLEKVLLVSGRLGATGGELLNDWKDLKISVDPNQLTQDYDISYYAAFDDEGRVYFQFETIPEMTADERFAVKIDKPTTAILIQNYLKPGTDKFLKLQELIRKNSSQNPKVRAGSSINNCLSELPDSNADGHSFEYLWQGNNAYFQDLRGYQVNGYPRVLSGVENTATEGLVEQCASALRSTLSWGDARLTNPKYDPVIFVHGFMFSGELGGGAAKDVEYFGFFPNEVEELQLSGSSRRFNPFLFQWRTNARFQDVATELGQAIKLVNRATGRKVHVVAHSFGGLLTRTLVQGLASDSKYTNEFARQTIASITTVGTPHSGIFGVGVNKEIEFDDEGTITFPNGVDGVLGTGTGLCRSISCYQAGVDWEVLHRRDSERVFGTRNNGPSGVSSEWNRYYKKAPGYIVYKLAKEFASYPTVPTRVLMGIVPASVACVKSDETGCNIQYVIDAITDHPGDGLISIEGQRIKPDLLLQPVYSGSSINEHLLSFNTTNFTVDGFDYVIDKMASGNVLDREITLPERMEVEFYQKYEEDYPRLVVGDHLKSYFYGTNHRTGNYGTKSSFNNISGFNRIGNFAITKLTEVGLINCPDESSECNHPTWLHFVDLVTQYTSESGLIQQSVTVSGTVTQNGAETPEFSYDVQVYANGEKLGNTVTITDSSEYQIDVDFKANTNYHVEIVPDSEVYRATNTQTILAADTVEETSLLFANIEFVSNTIEQGIMLVSLKDGTTGGDLSEFDVEVIAYSGVEVFNQHVDSQNLSLTLPVGNYMVLISKDNYLQGIAKACYVVKNQQTSCELSLVPESHVEQGTLTSVLTWGENPQDLDTHLLKYDADSNLLYHLYWRDLTDSLTGDNIDVDDQTSYGPETVTIQEVDVTASYFYFVHHYAGSGSISTTSDAAVTIQTSDLSRTYNAPTSGSGQWWHVYTLTNGRIIPCQTECIFDTQAAAKVKIAKQLIQTEEKIKPIISQSQQR